MAPILWQFMRIATTAPISAVAIGAGLSEPEEESHVPEDSVPLQVFVLSRCVNSEDTPAPPHGRGGQA
jgi:hypothetical protein